MACWKRQERKEGKASCVGDAQQCARVLVTRWWECHHCCTTQQHMHASPRLHSGSASKPLHPQLSGLVHSAGGTCAHASCCSEVHITLTAMFPSHPYIISSSAQALSLFFLTCIYISMSSLIVWDSNEICAVLTITGQPSWSFN